MTEPAPAASPTASAPPAAAPYTESAAAQAPAAAPSTESAAAQAPAAAPSTESAAAQAPAAAASEGGTHIKTSDITAGPGGVMTNEVGVITGELTLRTEYAAGKVTVHVQYKDADEWYVLTGGKAKLADIADLDAVHSIVVGLLNRPEG